MIIEIIIIAILISISCSILGSFLMLKNMAMITDAISHTVLLGIVLAFFITHDLNSPLLIVGASIVGVITVFFIELLINSKLLKEDAAIGIIFSLLFSIAIVLISKYTGNIHLDVDAVLMGEIAFTPFNRVDIFSLSIPKGIVTNGIILIINAIFVNLFYKEIKISIFDKELAKTLGMKPMLIHYILIFLTSITITTSFESVGSILVVVFMIGPPITAFLITKNLKKLILVSICLGIISTILGVLIALFFDVSISGMISVVIGIIFFIVFVFSKEKCYNKKN